MLKDIDFKKKLDVGVVVVKDDEGYNTYIVNFRKEEINNVLITSKGFGEVGGRKKETTVFRKVIEKMAPESFMKFEPLDPELFQIFNEFWVSFSSQSDGMLDKKFLFAPESIIEANFITVPFIKKKGVMIRQ
jgi:hypothetical protein